MLNIENYNLFWYMALALNVEQYKFHCSKLKGVVFN